MQRPHQHYLLRGDGPTHPPPTHPDTVYHTSCYGGFWGTVVSKRDTSLSSWNRRSSRGSRCETRTQAHKTTRHGVKETAHRSNEQSGHLLERDDRGASPEEGGFKAETQRASVTMCGGRGWGDPRTEAGTRVPRRVPSWIEARRRSHVKKPGEEDGPVRDNLKQKGWPTWRSLLAAREAEGREGSDLETPTRVNEATGTRERKPA